MAEQPAVAAVIGQRERAVDALHALAAGTAGHEAAKIRAGSAAPSPVRCSPAVPEWPRSARAKRSHVCGFRETPAACRPRCTSGMGRSAMRSGNSSSVYLPDDALKRLSRLGVADPSTTQAFAACARTMATSRPLYRGVLFLLVTGVVLFIDHDQPQIPHRRKHAGSRSDHHARAACANSAPLIGALGIAEGAVQNGHPIAEARVELPRHRGRQRDLRHQQQRAPPARQRRIDGIQINLGLARSGDAVQQKRAEFFGLDARRRSDRKRCAARRSDRAERGSARCGSPSAPASASPASLRASDRAAVLAFFGPCPPVRPDCACRDAATR